MDFLTVLTPTYNRSSYLYEIYNSLEQQTCDCFTWLVIDDGSDDETENVMEDIISNHTASFIINYQKKINGGKHSALNYSHKFLDSQYVMVLDSDDIIIKDGIKLIHDYILKFSDNNNIGWFAFLKRDKSNKYSEKKYKKHLEITNYVTYMNEGRKGECCDVYLVRAFKTYPYPELPNEKFVSESYLNIMAAVYGNYDMVTINEYVQLTDYQEDGLTNYGRRLQLNNPVGNAELWRHVAKKPFNIKQRLKGNLLFSVYSMFGNKKISTIIRTSKEPFLTLLIIPISICLKNYWEKKYFKE